MDRETLLTVGEPYLLEAIENGLTESLMLELKSISEDEPIFRGGALTPKGRTLIGKSLGAFANSAGGMLIIGVKCAKDVATGVSPVPMVQRAAASLVGQIGELLLPRHEGIKVDVIPSADDAGYVVVEVARSERRPHMSFDHRYYKRAGSSSFVMEHYDVEDAFRRVASPDLDLSWRLARGSSDGQSYVHLAIAFEMTNHGQSTAKHISMSVLKFTQTMAEFQSGGGFVVSRAGGRTIVSAVDRALNPRQSMPFHVATVLASRSRGEPWMVLGTPVRSVSLDWEIELSAENMLPKRGRVSVSGEQLASWLPP